ncbi:MAG: SRPBCC domain-containing protein [Pseudomonadota bacterium]
MDMTGEYRIEAPRERVWEGLNDPEVLKQCIPGCEEIIQKSETELSAKVTAKVGPVKAKFSGDVTLSDVVPPESYTISGEGKGGPAGFAKGGAKVKLAEDGADATLLSYEVDAQVGGKLAQIGARLINGTAKKMADDFFGKFADVITAPVGDAPTDNEDDAVEPVSDTVTETAEAVAETSSETVGTVTDAAETAVETVAASVSETPAPAASTGDALDNAAAKVASATAGPMASSQKAIDRMEEAVQKAGGGAVSPLVWVLGVVAIILVLVSVFS